MTNMIKWIKSFIQPNAVDEQPDVPFRIRTVSISKKNTNNLKIGIIDSTSNHKIYFELKKQVDPFAPVEYNGNIPIIPLDSPELFGYFTERHQDVVSKYIFGEMKRGVEEKKDTVVLFQFGNTNKLATIQSPHYDTQLNKLLKYFIKVEDYESASQCRDTISLNRHQSKK